MFRRNDQVTIIFSTLKASSITASKLLVSAGKYCGYIPGFLSQVSQDTWILVSVAIMVLLERHVEVTQSSSRLGSYAMLYGS